jgi:hypothetical protein
MASDELTVDQKEVDKVRARLNATSDQTRNTVRKIAQQANRAKRNISLNGKPSLRRVLLADMLIDAIEQDAGETNLLEAALSHLGLRTAHTLGFDVGTLDIDAIGRMSELLAAISDGQLGLQYNTQNNTFTIGEQKADKK